VRLLGLQVKTQRVAAVRLQAGPGGGVPVPGQAQLAERCVVGMAMGFIVDHRSLLLQLHEANVGRKND
jgi:hypothetical protein